MLSSVTGGAIPAVSFLVLAIRFCVFAAGDREDGVFGVDTDVAGNTAYSAFAVAYLVEDAPANEPVDVLLTVDSEGGNGADETADTDEDVTMTRRTPRDDSDDDDGHDADDY